LKNNIPESFFEKEDTLENEVTETDDFFVEETSTCYHALILLLRQHPYSFIYGPALDEVMATTQKLQNSIFFEKSLTVQCFDPSDSEVLAKEPIRIVFYEACRKNSQTQPSLRSLGRESWEENGTKIDNQSLVLVKLGAQPVSEESFKVLAFLFNVRDLKERDPAHKQYFGYHDYGSIFENIDHWTDKASFEYLILNKIEWECLKDNFDLPLGQQIFVFRLFLNMMSPVGISPVSGFHRLFLADKILMGNIPGESISSEPVHNRKERNKMPSNSPLLHDIKLSIMMPKYTKKDQKNISKEILQSCRNYTVSSWKDWITKTLNDINSKVESIRLTNLLDQAKSKEKSHAKRMSALDQTTREVLKVAGRSLLIYDPPRTLSKFGVYQEKKMEEKTFSDMRFITKFVDANDYAGYGIYEFNKVKCC
jgi:hypothetical protein